MSTAVMQHPTPTPPSNELQYGLHHTARHNAASPLHEDWRAANDYAQNQNHGSPGLMQQSADPYLNESYGDDQYSEDSPSGTVGLGIQYPGYAGQPDYLSSGPDALSGSPYVDHLSQTPMTPQSDASFGVRTRSGRSAARSDSPSVLGSQTNARVTKSRPKKSRSNKAVNNRTPKLDAPLSELTKDMEIQVRDMVAWVNRSDEERHAEVEKRNGYVTRPMNSFMLYRSAFAERTKQWCLQNNHQVVSSVSGESWPLEPDSVRDHYNNLAKIERENHAHAHPSYKFSPSKTPTAAKKKRTDISDEEEADDGTESGDPDWEWRPRNGGSVRTRPKRQGREAGYPANNQNLNSMFEQQALGFEQGGMNGYPWNPPRSTPYGVDQYDHFEQYDQSYHGHSDMGFANQPIMMNGFQNAMPTGMPAIGYDGMLQHEQNFMGPAGHQVDPMLLMGSPFGNDMTSEHQPKFEHEQMGNPWEMGTADAFGEGMEHWATSGQI